MILLLRKTRERVSLVYKFRYTSIDTVLGGEYKLT